MLSDISKVSFQDKKIQVDDQLFYVIDSTAQFNVEMVLGYDAVIIDAQDQFLTRFIIKKIRSQFNHEYYLKPIFLLNPRETDDPYIKHLNDGIIFSPDQIRECAEKSKKIFQRSTQINFVQPSSFYGQIIKKTFDYMYTREMRSLIPYVDMNSSVGYSWPEISVNFDGHEEHQTLDILEWAEREGLIWPDFNDRIYLCNHCSNGYLMLREVCPHCNSSNIKSEDLVHHFPCAYVGPLSDFKNNIDNNLVCPKCNKVLRHIGVDYDKPSVVNHCNSCDKTFQDFYIKAKCLQCMHDTEVQYLVPKNIYTYKQTKKGRSVSVTGLYASYERVDDVEGSIPFETYKVLLHYQVERIRNNALLNTYIGVMIMDNIYELFNVMGNKGQKKLLRDIIQIIREGMKTDDVVALESPTTIHLAINDVDSQSAIRIMGTLESKLKKIISDNFKGFTLSTRSLMMPVNMQSNAENQLAVLTKKLAE